MFSGAIFLYIKRLRLGDPERRRTPGQQIHKETILACGASGENRAQVGASRLNGGQGKHGAKMRVNPPSHPRVSLRLRAFPVYFHAHELDSWRIPDEARRPRISRYSPPSGHRLTRRASCRKRILTNQRLLGHRRT